MSSLDSVTVTAFCYVLECESRSDLEQALPCSYYIGSTSNTNMRIAQHFSGRGSKFTRANHPIRLAEIDVQPRLTAGEVLAFENETTMRYMLQMIRDHGPDAWRAVCGGSWCKLDQNMPGELRRRLTDLPDATQPEDSQGR